MVTTLVTIQGRYRIPGVLKLVSLPYLVPIKVRWPTLTCIQKWKALSHGGWAGFCIRSLLYRSMLPPMFDSSILPLRYSNTIKENTTWTQHDLTNSERKECCLNNICDKEKILKNNDVYGYCTKSRYKKFCLYFSKKSFAGENVVSMISMSYLKMDDTETCSPACTG